MLGDYNGRQVCMPICREVAPGIPLQPYNLGVEAMWHLGFGEKEDCQSDLRISAFLQC